MKIVSIEEMRERINKKFPEQPFELIKYTKFNPKIRYLSVEVSTCNRRLLKFLNFDLLLERA